MKKQNIKQPLRCVCSKCGFSWWARVSYPPLKCPACGNRRWNQKRGKQRCQKK